MFIRCIILYAIGSLLISSLALEMYMSQREVSMLEV